MNERMGYAPDRKAAYRRSWCWRAQLVSWFHLGFQERTVSGSGSEIRGHAKTYLNVIQDSEKPMRMHATPEGSTCYWPWLGMKEERGRDRGRVEARARGRTSATSAGLRIARRLRSRAGERASGPSSRGSMCTLQRRTMETPRSCRSAACDPESQSADEPTTGVAWVS
jgi:hypothetical protein